MTDLPSDVRDLLEERSAARADRDWARADELRARLRDLGWEPQDTASGSTARPILPAATDLELPSLLDEPPTMAASVQLLAGEHPEDLRRFLVGFGAHPPSVGHEVLVVDDAPSADLEAVIDGSGVAATVLGTGQPLGWADARNLGMRRSRGEITVLVDTSLEPTGDFLGPLLAAFDDATVGVAGGWGVRSDDGRHFEEAPAGEVDAIEAYCLAIRREALRAVTGFDHRFRFYRNADLDLSFAIRDRGWRAIRTDPLPFRRHEHRGYAALPDDERDRLSRRNFYRFLKHWGDRRDLLLGTDRDGG
jgi:cysteinyl-tRNA synthetase